jgi:hypothetical protein
MNIRQGLEIQPDGTRAFVDYFGDDFDMYICRSYDIFYSYLDFYEDPEITEWNLDHMSDGDFDLPKDHDRHEIAFSDVPNLMRKMGLRVFVIDEDFDFENLMREQMV